MAPLSIKASLDALLAKVPIDAPQPLFKCVACEDSGFVVVVDSAGVSRSGKCQDCRRYVPELVKGVPAALRDVTLDSIFIDNENRAALAIVREVAEGRSHARGDLLLFGPTGTGKTWAAVAALNSVCQMRRTNGLMVKSLELLRRLQPGQDEEARADFFDSLITVPVLLVDDLGAEQATDYARRTLFEGYETRHDRGLMTITTTNLDLDTLARHFDDERLVSRLAGWARVIPMKGHDRRLVRLRSEGAIRAVR